MSTSAPTLDRPAPPPPAPPAGHPGQQPIPTGWRRDRPAPAVRQLVTSLLVLPLTLLPFLAYATLTPEGRLLRDRVSVTLFPPHLVTLTSPQRAAALAVAPRYDGPVMALAYHGIGSSSDGEGGFVVSARRFGEHLATLEAAGMRTVTASQVADALSGGRPLPPNAVMISFDDGRSDAMMFADPLLRQAGMSATMFVIAGAASERGVYYTPWERIEAYARSGRWDIQSHTDAAHREQDVRGGGSLPALTSRARGESLVEYRQRVRDDLRRASAAIESHVGRRPAAFAYPFGAYGADRTNDPAIAEVLREEVARQYRVAFQQDGQETVPLLTADQDLLRLRRLEVEDWSGIELLRRIERARQELAGAEAAPAPPATPDPPQGLDGAPEPTGAAPTAGTASTARRASPGAGAAAPSSQASPGTSAGTGSLPPAAAAGGGNVAPTPPTTAPPPVSSPPTTVRPTTPPTTTPTTSPPPTSPPTTVCRTAGNSDRCPPGRT